MRVETIPYRPMRNSHAATVVELGDAAGAVGYALIGLAGLVFTMKRMPLTLIGRERTVDVGVGCHTTVVTQGRPGQAEWSAPAPAPRPPA